MKLIDEGIARLSEQAAAENWPNGKLYNAIYCMGLERAAREVEKSEWCRKVGMVQRIHALGDGA